MKNFLLLFAFSALSLCSLQAQESPYSFMETYSIELPGELNINSKDSSIEVVAHDSNQVVVYYTVTKNHQLLKVDRKELDELLDKQAILEVKETVNSLNISVTSTVTGGYIQFEDAIIIDYKIYVPKEIAGNLITSDGDITVTGLSLFQTCATHDGDIKLTNLSGGAKVESQDGDIILNNVSGSVSGTTSDGDISVEKLGAIKELSLKTVDGDIRVAIPQKFGVSLRAEGESFDIPKTNFKGETSSRSVNGAINGGGARMDLSTNDGVVKITENQ